MNNNLFILAVFWGVWIIIPVLFDGLMTLTFMITILIKDRRYKVHLLEGSDLPIVSIIIPTFNEEDNIDQCLSFIEKQSYPQEKIEIIVVDNGSTDITAEIVRRKINEINNRSDQFRGTIDLIVKSQKGKARALNTGILASRGEIIVNIDCRSFLEKNAIYNLVAKFIENPEYGALTGNIEIDWRIIYVRDENGRVMADENNNFIVRQLTRKERFLGISQFLEYLTSFRLGRQFQDITDSMFTLSGAFSAFKRDVLLKTELYKDRTVSEDTDMTLDLAGNGVRVGFVKDAKAYLRPVLSFEKMYAQRFRWHRGQIEVIGVHIDWYGNHRKNFFRAFWHSVMLLVDHTFGFPRLIWTFMLPIFFIFGYSTRLIVISIFIMWGFYVLVDLLNAWFCYAASDRETRAKIIINLHYVLATPIFRIFVFYCRFAGYLAVLKEEPAWTTPHNPIHSTKNLFAKVYEVYNRLNKGWIAKIMGLPPASGRQYEEKIAEVDDYGFAKTQEKIEEKQI